MQGSHTFSAAKLNEIKKLANQKKIIEHDTLQATYLHRAIEQAGKAAFGQSSKVQYPIDHVNKVFQNAGLFYFPIYCDPPRWIWVGGNPGRRVYDDFGRLLYMAPKTAKRRVRAEDFAPLPEFEQIYPPHPDPALATPEEKSDRIKMYLNLYSMSGMVVPSSKAVGISYMQLLAWINESEEYQQMAMLATMSAKQIMVDVARDRAMSGDSGLMRFFLEADNPELRRGGKSGSKGAGELPEGVSADAINIALNQVKAAGVASATRVLPPPEVDEVQIVDMASIASLVNQKAQEAVSLIPPSYAKHPDIRDVE